MALKILTLSRLGEFLTECKKIFASQIETTANTLDINEHLLNIDYESALWFDTSEIISDQDTIPSEDVILEENESLISILSDEILVDANDAYIIIERGE